MKVLVITGLFLLSIIVNADEVEKVKFYCQAIVYDSVRTSSGDGRVYVEVCKVTKSMRILSQNAEISNTPDYVFESIPTLGEFMLTRVTHIELIELVHFDVPSEVHSIPKNLKSKFRSLKALRFDEQPIEVLRTDDLKQFGEDLELLMVIKGNIQYFEKDLFQHNPKLKFFQCSDHPLKYIEPGFFNNIREMQSKMQLKTLILTNLTCLGDTVKDLLTIEEEKMICYDRSVMTKVTQDKQSD